MKPRICILGAGPGGYAAAIRASQLGALVTLVEKEAPGGTCLNWGCVPSKVMITTAGLIRQFRKAQYFGISVSGEIRPDMGLLMARKEKVISDHIQGLLKLFDQHRITYIRGTGVIEDQGAVRVETADGDVEIIGWDRLIVATGTRPLELPGIAFDGERILSSDHALSLRAVPGSVVILGGGVIGCEFAAMLSALGAQVTVIEALPRLLPLPSIDEAVSKVLLREFKKQKIQVMVNRTAVSVDAVGDRIQVTTGPSPYWENPSEREREPRIVEADKLLVCVGRAPNTSGIGLESVEVDCDAKGWIIADSALRTGRKGVWAIGDVLGPSRVMLAHAAAAEGEIAAANAMGADLEMDYHFVPAGIFTHPEVAAIGHTRAQAALERIPVGAESVLFRTVGKAQIIDEIAGEATIVFHEKTGRVLGVHMIGPHATDLIAEATLAVRNRLTVSDLVNTIHAHPTLSEVIHETALKALGRPLHG
ncbi:MAG: dihydrolipoyl dehydrogenase [Desulfobacterales bacterium]|jgi:dihydrolipoamide dehydrogenase